MRISAVLACHNEERFIQDWLEDAVGYADELLLAVHAPTDATAEIIARFKPHSPVPMVCLWFPAETVARFGFSLMKNELIARGRGDWITSIDADEEIGLHPDRLRDELDAAESHGRSCMSLLWSEGPADGGLTPHLQNHLAALAPRQRRAVLRSIHVPQTPPTSKIKIFKSHAGYWWHGLLHEHILRRGQPAEASCWRCDHLLHHYAYLSPSAPEWKQPLYAYLLCRIVDCAWLRTGTNPWWTGAFYARHAASLRTQAEMFVARQSEWFPSVPRTEL
ncbi:MAG: glycosyltransferase family 2 protein [Aureliella sp.]